VTGYCAACGKKAPSSSARDAPELDPLRLAERRWLCVAAKPLAGQDRDVGWNLLCPTCLKRRPPFAAALLDAWGVRPEELARLERKPGRS